ncbi:MAG: cellulase family glycosylhydrolase [Candidatus Hydrogenedentes bacterium]|nr:cellulase family glycosylhydrolase [Candidatus Hydrogenedentota bacterium]
MNTRFAIGLIVAAVAIACTGCGKEPQEPPALPEPEPAQQPAPAPAPEPAEPTGAAAGFISVKNGAFVDPEGRQILLHGLSVISKDKSAGYVSGHGPAEFAAMREWGMNCIRLGIIWDGLEPEPGLFDDAYLEKIDQRIEWAREQGLYVFLDMHQDLFSVKYSDGAPEWATLDEGLPHDTSGSVWSDAYFNSSAVQKAFDNFWANASCADGVGVQDHFARAWRHVAERYASNTTVIGYDLFNEPNIGGQNTDGQLLMIAAGAAALAAKDGPDAPGVEELALEWLDPEGRSRLMKRLEDMDIYVPVVDAPQALFQEFERTKVTPMFERVTHAIREVDANHIVFLETGMAANMGVYSGIEPVMGPDGIRDPYQAYAPHGYDVVVDTPDVANANSDRIRLIFQRHGETGRRLNMPVLVGEWGAYGHARGVLPTAWVVVGEFEKLLFSDTYWLYSTDLAEADCFPALCRAIPVRIGGTLLAYRNNPETGAFTCSWKEDPAVTAPTRIYLPGRVFSGPDAVRLTPEGAPFEVEPAADGSASACLVIPPTGEPVERSLSIR